MISPDEHQQRRSVSDLIQAERAVVAERRARERALELAIEFSRGGVPSNCRNVRHLAEKFRLYIETGDTTS